MGICQARMDLFTREVLILLANVLSSKLISLIIYPVIDGWTRLISFMGEESLDLFLDNMHNVFIFQNVI